MYIKARDVKID